MTAEGYAPFRDWRTWYRVTGDPHADKAPVVVLHGGPGATHDYLLSVNDLAEQGRAVVMYDQLGNGRSTHLPDRGADFWTVELFVDELASLLRHLGIDGRYHVVGQSWGGFLAQEHALTQPAGLRGLVLADTAASFPAFVEGANRLRAELPPGSTRPCSGTRRRAPPTTPSTSPRARSSTTATSAASCPTRPRSRTPSRRSTPTRPSTTR